MIQKFIEGAFLNDVTQVGGQFICDARFKDVSKIAILVWQRGREVSEKVQICVTSFMIDPFR